MFNGIYAGAGGDDAAVPWQHAPSRALVERWIAGLDRVAHRRALVVAAGLGDDAAALAALGFEVTAFDRSEAAIAWARERHPDVAVTWEVADLFDPPAAWAGAFDLVVEVFTIQSIPVVDQGGAASTIAGFVGSDGTLFLVALVHEPGFDSTGPPWPLDRSTLDGLEAQVDGGPGLERRGGDEAELGPSVRLVTRELHRPVT